MIVVKPRGGLCNRMRVINSFYSVAKQTGHRLIIIWREDEELYCNYEALFSLPEEITVLHAPSNCGTFFRKLFTLFTKVFALVCALFGVDDVFIQKHRDNVKVIISKKKVLFANTCEAILEQKECTIFRPSAEVIRRVSKFKKHFGARVVGVHIRRTDNSRAISNSPLELFIKTMQQELMTDSRTQFFLATDDEEVRAGLRERFGERVLFNVDAVLSRESENGAIDAYVDLLLLAETIKIYGSYWSSFSEQAAIIGNIPLQVLKSGGLPC